MKFVITVISFVKHLNLHILDVLFSGSKTVAKVYVMPLETQWSQTLVKAFISCQLDYCNLLLYKIADSQLRQLQSVQNAAARLMTGMRRMEHITPVLQSLHWLPVWQRILFKLVVSVRKCLSGCAPAYLADDCHLIRCCRSGLRLSSSPTKLEVPPTRTTFGDRSFVVDGPHVWNSLSASIHDPSLTLAVFSNRLKTDFFEQ